MSTAIDQPLRTSTTNTQPVPNNSGRTEEHDDPMVARISYPIMTGGASTTATTPPLTPNRGRTSSLTVAGLSKKSPTPSYNNRPIVQSQPTDPSGSPLPPPNRTRRATYDAGNSPTNMTAIFHNSLPVMDGSNSSTNAPFHAATTMSQSLNSHMRTSTTTKPHSDSSMVNPGATAPVVGRHHKKSNSLVGFDPLLAVVSPGSPSNRNTTTSNGSPSTPPGADFQDLVASMTNMTTSPPSPPRHPTGNMATTPPSSARIISNNNGDMPTELWKLAKDVKAVSPQRPTDKPSKARKSVLAKLTLTPPLRFDKTNVDKGERGKMPWQRHRRTRSLETPADIMQDLENRPKADALPNTSMIQDLYDVVAHEPLTIPSLAKPAPTSFLTGREIVRSSEMDPSPFQCEIPDLADTLVASRLVQFVDQYRKEDCNLDLQASLVGVRRIDLQSFLTLGKVLPYLTGGAHKALVESILEAGEDVVVQGFVPQFNATSADTRREVVIFERQRQFVVAFRGTSKEQVGKESLFKPKKQPVLVKLDDVEADIQVFDCIKEAYLELETRVFAVLDQLMDENPFCDVVFTGASFGGAMATLAAYRYATSRPVVRVACQTFGSPKVGNRVLRQQANSLPNLKVMRVEFASDPKCYQPAEGSHVGHSIVLSEKSDNAPLAYKFDDDHDARKPQHIHAPSKLFKGAWKKEDRDIPFYVSILEDMRQKKTSWVNSFAGEDGAGVRGKDNERRNMV